MGQALIEDPRLDGVVFTGSYETARHINKTLAARPGPIIPLIAETGGLNAMIVDASALPEQVALDVVNSAFRSAGQRCSALRILYLQEEIAEEYLNSIKGAMDCLQIGSTENLTIDVGPVIDAGAQKDLEAHAQEIKKVARESYILPLPKTAKAGTFVAPQLHVLEDPSLVKKEVFGPILHVVTWKAKDLEKVIDQVNTSGYGLTLGIHSRINETVQKIRRNVRVGNCYVNRNMIGAVVGSQPFGGEGLSGTGPKAGGPHYLHGFCTERAYSEDTTASGGNASLLTLSD